MTYTMTVNTTPVPKGRPRFYGNHAVTPEKTRIYEALIRDSWTYGKMEGPIIVSMKFTFEIPKSYSKKKRSELLYRPKTTKPDLDNLVKAVLDGLQGEVGAFDDDSIVCGIVATKEYGTEPKVSIVVEEVKV